MSAAHRDLRLLASQLQGRVILPGEADYDTARRVWNGMIDKHPGAIARCVSAGDVVAAIQFAANRDMLVSVRGGGHNIAGNAVCDDGLVIDLSPMKDIHVDRERQVARAGGGVVWGELDAATQQYGLATTGGLIPSTGIAGFTLGGGLGYLMRSYGLACDNLTSVEIVTAAGERLVTSPTSHEDLFWAVRGGGGNFGVVTSFAFRLHDVGPRLVAGTVAYPLVQARNVLRFYREWAKEMPNSLIAYAGLSTGPDGVRRVGVRAVYPGSLEDGERLVEPLQRFGTPDVNDIRPRTYGEIQRLVEPMFPPGRLNYWKANFLDELSDELIELVVEAFASVPSPYSAIAFEQMGGAVACVGADETAFSHRSAAFSLLFLGGWDDPQANDANVAWVRGLWERSRPLASAGVYVNYLGTEGDERIHDAYGHNYARLVSVKQQYDPQNFFRLNQNIHPESSLGG
jgi:FAD binding domain/Berberine and berberine like